MSAITFQCNADDPCFTAHGRDAFSLHRLCGDTIRFSIEFDRHGVEKLLKMLTHTLAEADDIYGVPKPETSADLLDEPRR